MLMPVKPPLPQPILFRINHAQSAGTENRRACQKKKWFQVTRFSARPATGMHGSGRAVQSAVHFPVNSPYGVFLTARINIFRRAAAFSFSESGPAPRNGFSLSRNGFRFHEHHSGVKAPNLLLRGPFGGFQARFASTLRLARFAPGRPLQRLSPLPVRCQTQSEPYHRLHSPLGLLPPSGSKRSAAAGPIGPPSGSARSPFAPQSLRLSLVCRIGSSFQVRYFSGGLLFLKPLGTIPTMRLLSARVNIFL